MMRMKGVTFHVISFNAAISACEKRDQKQQIWLLLHRMRGQSIYVINCAAEISAHEKKEQRAQPVVLLNMMRNWSMMSDVITLNAAISTCMKREQWKQAWVLRHRMSDRGSVPDVIIFNAAISSCEKGKQWEQAWVLPHMMRGQNTYVISLNAALPDGKALEASIRAASQDAQGLSLLVMLHKMRQADMAANVISPQWVQFAMREERAVGAGLGAASQDT